MRIIVKFTATLLVGICSIIAVSAVQTWQREVAFFDSDMRLDHLVVGEAITMMVRRTWTEHGKQEAMREPQSIDRQDRHLALRLFEPYFSTKSSGTGLGLAIVKRTIEAFGGTVALEARAEGGTRAKVRLPVMPAG